MSEILDVVDDAAHAIGVAPLENTFIQTARKIFDERDLEEFKKSSPECAAK